MELMAGTTLQGNKYVVQEILNQTEQEITCKATHTYLDQMVILQTFNPALQQQTNFPQLKQQFIAGVRSIAKQTTRLPLQVLDYFEEDGLPFVVLPFVDLPSPPDVPKLNDWLAQPASTALTSTTIPETTGESSTETPSLLPAPTAVAVAPSAESSAVASTAVDDRLMVGTSESSFATSLSQPDRSRTYEPIIFQPTPRLDGPGLTQAVDTRETEAPLGRSSQKRLKSKFPVMLMVIAVTSGLVGVGTGLALRFASTPQNNGAKPRLSFFQRQQSFPGEGNWPVQEMPIYTPSEPTIEQPLYRAAPPGDYGDPTAIPSPPIDSVPYVEPSPEELTPLPEYTEPADSLEAPPLKTEPKQPPELAPLPESAPVIPEYTLPPESTEPPPLITDPPAPLPIDPNSVNPSPKPLLGNSSRIVTQ